MATLMALGLGGVMASPGLAAEPGLMRVRLGGDSTGTRIVFDLGKSASPNVSIGKDELTVAFSQLGASASTGGAQGLVRGWTVSSSPLGSKVELDLAPGASIERRFMLPPADGVTNYRYVVDLKGPGASTAAAAPAMASMTTTTTTTTTVTAAAGDKAPAEKSATATPKAAVSKISAGKPVAASARRVIVIDAGHGGKDPGASGATAKEKAVTLAAALALRDTLTKTGRYKVVMTRDSDRFIELNQRVAIARAAKADLFISLHADSGADPGRRGASVYTLSDQGAARVGEVLGRNDKMLTAYNGKDASVSRILLDLSQRATKNRSAAFAETLLDHIGLETPLLERSHRDAGYFVLLAPDVPAVLLEMGFITNSQDEKALADSKHRAALMAQVASAIDGYFRGEQGLSVN
ncbi:MAG: N-acetylmuramoyl-L-alanine amidase [Caulobacteraceae bacterium]|nr:N-acetylmuramoyl-L-alanine amidase [Caulobacteraceae bacterium]